MQRRSFGDLHWEEVWSNSQMCYKQCPRQKLHIHSEKIPYLLHGLPITLAFFPSACKMRMLAVNCTSNVLLKFNTLGKCLPSIFVKLRNLRYKISHNAIILSETFNSNPDHLAESVYHICSMRLTVSNVK